MINKITFLSLLLLPFFSFSQVISFECNNEIIAVDFSDIANDVNVYVDWNNDNTVDESDYLLYLYELYDCEDWGDDEDNDWGDVFAFECNGEEVIIELTDMNDSIDYEAYIESVLSDYDCEEWGDDEDNDWGDEIDGEGEENDDFNWDIENENDWYFSDINWILSDWEEFNWDIYWEEFNLSDIDWENIIWDIVIELDVSPEDFIDYILSILGQSFSWDSFFMSQSCIDDDLALQGGLAGLGISVNGCEDGLAYLLGMGYGCFDSVTIPGLSSEPIMPSEVCCETCEEFIVEGCTDSTACNYNSEATTDDGSCIYGDVECFVSPCSVAEDPGVDGAYCVDDYCGGCCALWYFSDGSLISNSCDINSDDNPAIGIWYDSEEDQYIEITDDVVGFYSLLDDSYFMCWYYWAIEYTYIGDGLMQVIDPDYGPTDIQGVILDNGNLQILDPEGEIIILSPIDELPELDMCNDNGSVNEGCDDIQGQWTFLNYAYMIIDDFGVKIMFTEESSLCYNVFTLSYSQDENSDVCQIFFFDEFSGYQFDFAEAFLNDDGTLSVTSIDSPDFPDTWVSDDTDISSLEMCVYGCIDPESCNFDPFANADDGTCGLIDDCGDCQVPYCYDMITNTPYYVAEPECNEGIWVGNDCENNEYCLSSSMNPYWNSGCVSLEENKKSVDLLKTTNIIGQNSSINQKGFKVYFYNDGSVRKRYIIKGE